MHIEYNFTRSCDELKINPAVGKSVFARIGEAYELYYFKNFQRERCDFQMIIVLKHVQAISSRTRRLSIADKRILRKILDNLSETNYSTELFTVCEFNRSNNKKR